MPGGDIYDGVLIPLALNGIDGTMNGAAARNCGRANSTVLGDGILLTIGRAGVYTECTSYVLIATRKQTCRAPHYTKRTL